MNQVKWFERQFHFDASYRMMPAVWERLAGTPARLEEKLGRIPADRLSKRSGQTWTIKENIGHLSDLESLWQDRIDDILTKQAEMRPADLSNRQTTQADHNSTPLPELLDRFRAMRATTLAKLERLTAQQMVLSSVHPRLKVPMRIIDHCIFVAEHDDHHLARITELSRLFDPAFGENQAFPE
ncbi:MAG TPA: DinB family protein [Chitinophagaceae bacterium]|nr:DinB family protein [Chitinophagaceae bacterium]